MKIKVKTAQDLFKREREAWLQDCRATARKLLQRKSEITINDVLAECPRPTYIHENATGSVFKDNDFRLVRYTKSHSRTAHRRVIGVWGLSQLQLPLNIHEYRKRDVEGE